MAIPIAKASVKWGIGIPKNIAIGIGIAIAIANGSANG
jgi:hypothetical protein